MKIINTDSPWPNRIIALLFAIVLFVFVQSENNSRTSTNSPTNGASVTSVEVVTDVPITIDMDTERFFVSGLPETATIRLEGSQSILTQTLGTRNFEIVTPDLNELGPGEHTIQLQTRRLSESLSYSIMPAEVMIKIEEKSVINHDVSAEFNDSSLASGYTAGTPIVTPDNVRISGAKSVIDKISEVSVLVLPDGTDITEDIEMTLPILVFDRNGELLNVNVEPSQVTVTVPVKGTHRNVPIVLRQSGEPHPNYNYELLLAEGEPENVTIRGREELLSAMENFAVEIDVSGVTESVTRSIRLTGPRGVIVERPELIKVIIRVTPVEEDSSEEEDTSGNGDATDEESDTSSQSTSSEGNSGN